jgi:recombination protein RecA
MYGEGISKEGDLLDLGVEKRIVEKSGTWFAFNGERLGQGRENAKQFLKDNRDTYKSIEEKVRKELGLDGAPKEAPAPAAAEPAAAAPIARGAGR